MMYEIQIGKRLRMKSEDYSKTFSSYSEPKIRIIINKDQKLIIEQMANKELTDELETIYTINQIKFKIAQHFDLTNNAPIP